MTTVSRGRCRAVHDSRHLTLGGLLALVWLPAIAVLSLLMLFGVSGPGHVLTLSRVSSNISVADDPGTAVRHSAKDLIQDSCSGPNPYFVTSRFYHPGAQIGAAAIIASRDTPNDAYVYPNNPSQVVLASGDYVGAVFGLAYDWRRGDLYSAAFHIVQSEFGIAGPGAIYRLSLQTGDISLAASVDAGPDRHQFGRPRYDAPAALWVGKTGLGDIDIDDDGSQLFVMNLADRRIHRFQLPSMVYLGSFAHGATGQPWEPNARPFGLAYHSGWLYHGVVDSRESSGVPGQLSVHIYRSQADGSEMSEVATVALDYPHRPQWSAWGDQLWPTWDPPSSMPILLDIVFSPHEDMILGIGDRQMFYDLGVFGHGDVVRLTPIDSSHWQLTDDVDHYDDDVVPTGNLPHQDEPLIGALAAMPGRDSVVVSAMRDDNQGNGGLRWFDNQTGRTSGPSDGFEWVFGDLPGIGDVEAICRPDSESTTTATPTSTPVLWTPTDTNTPTGTPTVTSVPTVTPAPPRPQSVYLPVTLRMSCSQRPPLVDLVFVLDMSSSMLRSTRDGRTKIAAAIEAADTILDVLRLDDRGAYSDRVAVVGFNGEAWIEQPLTSDRTMLVQRLGQLEQHVAEGTRLDLGLSRAIEALDGISRSRGEAPSVLLLTDGLPNQVPPAEDGRVETTILRIAAQLKSEATIYTVGLGLPADIDQSLLESIAGDTSRFILAPDGEDLKVIFQGIARSGMCP